VYDIIVGNHENIPKKCSIWSVNTTVVVVPCSWTNLYCLEFDRASILYSCMISHLWLKLSKIIK